MTLPAGPPGETREERVERIYARAEQRLEVINARRVRRGPEVLIGVSAVLCLAVGVVAAVDLRRLASPEGAALAWTGAAVFGDCPAYLDRSIADPPGSETRSDDELCQALLTGTAEDRRASATISVDLLAVERARSSATARMRITRPDGVTDVSLPMVERDGGWVVRRTEQVCRVVGCA